MLKLVKNKVRRAVIMYPDFIELTSFMPKSGVSVEEIFTVYIHKSLAKKIAVLNNK